MQQKVLMQKIDRLYLHFPFCRHLCNYCDFFKYKMIDERADIGKFNQQVLDQCKEHVNLLSNHQSILVPLRSLYFGGGTPSLWGELGADFFKNEVLGKYITLQENCEFTIEVDPKSWSREGLESWMELGVNRFSVGTQSFDPRFIEIMDRDHSFQDTVDLLEFLKEKDANFSVDFMLGLPYSEKYKRNIIEELKGVLGYRPNHLSLYILTARSNYPHKDDIPDDEFTSKEYILVSDFLKSQGFDHYEVSNFAKDGYRSKHNTAYWKYESVAAIGANATGLIVKGNSAFRYQWKSQSVGVTSEELDEVAFKLERFYSQVRANIGLKLDSFFDGEQLLQSVEIMNKFVQSGHIYEENNEYFATSHGFLILDTIVDKFFTHNLL